MASALIYCPSGGGKTVNATLVKGEKNLLLCSDNSHVVLQNFDRPNLDIQVIEHWMDTDSKGKKQECFIKQFEAATETKKYNNIIVDNLSDLFDLAILEMDESGRFKDMRQAYQLTYQSLKRLSRGAARVNANVIFTAWHNVREVAQPDGSIIQRIEPKLPMKILDNILGLTQVVAYINTAEKDGQKRWYYVLQGGPGLYAKDQLFCRKSCLPENLFTEVKK